MVNVAQLVRVLDCGSRGREFETHHSPYFLIMELNDINILDFGNKIKMCGLIMSDEDKVYNLLLPSTKIDDIIDLEFETLDMSVEEWLILFKQLDTVETECIRDGQKIILRKSQQIIDNNIAWRVFRRDNFKCRYCAIDSVPMTYDHIITWESGGPTTEENGLTSCRKCNKHRGNLDYGSWLQHKYYLEKSKFLSDKIRQANLDILKTLNQIELVKNIKSR